MKLAQNTEIFLKFYFFFLVLTGLEFLALSVIDFNALGMSDKWRFTNSSYLTLTFYLLFAVFSCLFVVPYIWLVSNSRFKKTSYNQKAVHLTKGQTWTCFVVIVTYFVLAEFVVAGNYRLDSGAMNKLIMLPLYSISYSFLLLFALNLGRRVGPSVRWSKVCFYILLFLLLISVTGAGVITCFGILYLARLGPQKKVYLEYF